MFEGSGTGSEYVPLTNGSGIPDPRGPETYGPDAQHWFAVSVPYFLKQFSVQC